MSGEVIAWMVFGVVVAVIALLMVVDARDNWW
jgi:hypothetical protein